MSKLGLEIQRLREAAGLSKRALAEKIGVQESYVGKLEAGKRKDPGGSTLYALSDALGVSDNHWRPFLAAEPAPAKPARKPRGKST